MHEKGEMLLEEKYCMKREIMPQLKSHETSTDGLSNPEWALFPSWWLNTKFLPLKEILLKIFQVSGLSFNPYKYWGEDVPEHHVALIERGILVTYLLWNEITALQWVRQIFRMPPQRAASRVRNPGETGPSSSPSPSHPPSRDPLKITGPYTFVRILTISFKYKLKFEKHPSEVWEESTLSSCDIQSVCSIPPVSAGVWWPVTHT